ncbi:hypothetical protein RND71_033535 [Anisodus tanguticus]|uniref:OPA3-like protein n=1 Tax=Anisodus tanguticus TaxID=243964 RepID=A0AAE1R9I5_9SOLA|nr:hypothetical protein RND71_033535 [Anisodus tanguticus]
MDGGDLGIVFDDNTFIGVFSLKILSNTDIKAMALPVLKLGTLALKTLSKPIGSRLKQQARLHPNFRNFIVSIAQENHRLTTTMQRKLYGHATDVEIRPLDEEKAVEAAVDLLGEVAVAALFFEYQRSSRSEAKKEELRKQELEQMRERDEALSREMDIMKRKIQELEQLARGRGLAGVFNFRPTQVEEGKSPTPA